MARLKIPYLKWRDGRPRWEPGPELRARGFKGQDLKAADGSWLDMGDAIDAARALNQNTSRTVDGRPQHRFCSARSVDELIIRFSESAKFTSTAPATQRSYRYHFRLIGEFCGDVPAAALSPAIIEEFHAVISGENGPATANAMLRTFKRIMFYAQKNLQWISSNPVTAVGQTRVAGRLVVWTAAEIAAFVSCADELGRASIGDAVLIAAMIGQRQADVLSLKECDFDGTAFTLRQQKTGRLVQPKAPALLVSRVLAARARKRLRWPKVSFTHEIINETSGRPYSGDYFRDQFAFVRAISSGEESTLTRLARQRGRAAQIDEARGLASFGKAPSLAHRKFSDLRDTAVTWLFAAGCSIAETCSVTGHSLKGAGEILDKHYFVRDDALAAAAGAKLDAYLNRTHKD